MSGDWIEWNGGDCPVSPDTLVTVRFRYGTEWPTPRRADAFGGWQHRGHTGDVVAYRVVQEEKKDDGWIEWHGGECPVLGDTLVYVKHRDGYEPCVRQALHRPREWRHEGGADDIVAYRVVPDSQPKAPIERALEAQADNIDATLEERGKRYGKFTGHAAITQSIKRAMASAPKYDALADDQKEALEMFAHKIGRILNGDPNYHDSWHDIVGYAKLVADRLKDGVEV